MDHREIASAIRREADLRLAWTVTVEAAQRYAAEFPSRGWPMSGDHLRHVQAFGE